MLFKFTLLLISVTDFSEGISGFYHNSLCIFDCIMIAFKERVRCKLAYTILSETANINIPGISRRGRYF